MKSVDLSGLISVTCVASVLKESIYHRIELHVFGSENTDIVGSGLWEL